MLAHMIEIEKVFPLLLAEVILEKEIVEESLGSTVTFVYNFVSCSTLFFHGVDFFRFPILVLM